MPQQMVPLVGPPTPSQSPHIHLIQNNSGSNTNQLLPSMAPPSSQNQSQQQQNLPLPNMPLQIVHMPPHMPQNGTVNPNSNHMPPSQNSNVPPHLHLQNHLNHPNQHHNHNSQNLPPPNQILQQIHHNNTNGANNNNTNIPGQLPQQQNGSNPNNGEEGNRWTQFQVQQLWRHHAYLNGNVLSTSNWSIVAAFSTIQSTKSQIHQYSKSNSPRSECWC